MDNKRVGGPLSRELGQKQIRVQDAPADGEESPFKNGSSTWGLRV